MSGRRRRTSRGWSAPLIAGIPGIAPGLESSSAYVPGWAAHEDVETVQLGFEGHTQGGHRRLGLLEKLLPLGQLRDRPPLHPSTHFDQLQKMGIGIDELLRNHKSRLKLPHLKIGVAASAATVIRVPTWSACAAGIHQQPRLCRDAALRRDRFPNSPQLQLCTHVDSGWYPGKTIRYRTSGASPHSGAGRARRLQIGCRQKLRAGCAAAARAWRTRAKQRQDPDFGPGRAARQSRAADRLKPVHQTVERRCRKFRLRRTGPGEIMKWSKIHSGLRHNADPRHNHHANRLTARMIAVALSAA